MHRFNRFIFGIWLLYGGAAGASPATITDELEQTSLQYFLTNAHPDTGLVRDTASNISGATEVDRRASIASTGFSLAVIANAGERGIIDRGFASRYVARTLHFVLTKMEQRNGWLFHFIDWETGKRWEKSEYSTIDTALFVAGALYASEVFPHSEIYEMAHALYERLDFEDMRTEGGSQPDKLILTSSYRPELGYSKFKWKDYAECTLLYLLGLGSPTHPLPAASWRAWQRESTVLPSGKTLVGYDKPLFTHQYSHLFIDFRSLRDAGINYFENAKLATLYNKRISDGQLQFATFKDGFWGLSAGDSPDGYRAFSPGRFDGTVCLGCTVASAMYLPRLVLGSAERWKHGSFGTEIWGPYGFSDSINVDRHWVSHQVHGITVGPIFLALANLREETSLWKHFNEIPAIKVGLERAGMLRRVSAINDNWHFTLGNNAEDPAGVNFSSATTVTLPHTWNVADATSPNYFRGVGWYERVIEAKVSSGEQLFLRVPAANAVADVFLNGRRVGGHRGGYTAFAFNLTPFLISGRDNRLAIRVDNSAGLEDVAPIEADFTFFGGLYRGVDLIRTSSVHVGVLDFASSGVYVTPRNVSAAMADVEVRTVIANDRSQSTIAMLDTELVGPDGAAVARDLRTVEIAANSDSTPRQQFTVKSPALWNSTGAPQLYRAVVRVSNSAGEVLDVVDQSFGVRSVSVDVNRGFILNGIPVELHGVSLHQDWAGKGWAVGERERNKNMDYIKDIGANAVRLAHYPRATDEVDLLDRSGIVAWSEIPLVNVVHPTPEFAETTKNQLREMIHQLYNHPAIVFWGLFNEIKSDPDNLVAELNRIAHADDPTRITAAATDQTPREPFNRITDIIAFNRYDGWYRGEWVDFGKYMDAARHELPGTPIAVSEYGAGASIANHETPPRRPTVGGRFHPEEWQSAFHESYLKQIAARPNIFAHFVWNLFDFAAPHRHEGEVFGMNDKGLVTYDRKVRKDAYYLYRANWNPSPTLYLASRRFTVRRGRQVDVVAYSNLERVDLTVNGQALPSKIGGGSKIFRWENIPLLPGNNRILASGSANGMQLRDDVTWVRE